MNSVQIPHNDAVFIVGATIFFVSIISYLIYNYSTNNSYEYFTCKSEKDVVEYDKIQKLDEDQEVNYEDQEVNYENQELNEDQEVNYENQELDEDQENPVEDYDYSAEEDYDYSTEEYESSDEDFNTDDCESESSSSDEDDSIAYRRIPRKKRCFHYIERKNRYCKKTPLFGSNYCSCHRVY